MYLLLFPLCWFVSGSLQTHHDISYLKNKIRWNPSSASALFSSYHLISLIHFMAKCLGKLILSSLYFLYSHSLLNPLQSSYPSPRECCKRQQRKGTVARERDDWILIQSGFVPTITPKLLLSRSIRALFPQGSRFPTRNYPPTKIYFQKKLASATAPTPAAERLGQLQASSWMQALYTRVTHSTNTVLIIRATIYCALTACQACTECFKCNFI